MSAQALPLPWDQIDTVLLDMDGTLLDLKFDNWFWLQHVPEMYGLRHGLTVDQAREQLAPRFAARQGQLAWYCLDHWSQELALDIRQLKHEQRRQIAWLEGAADFLKRLQRTGKRRWLVTNAHPDAYALKNDQLGLAAYMDAVYSTHPLGAPKESGEFWPRFLRVAPFDPARTLLVDDSLPVLRAAQTFGIRWLRCIRRPDSRHPPRGTAEFVGVDAVTDLL